MSCTNNLDLAVFPDIDKHHTANLRARAIGKVINLNDIWTSYKLVQKELSSVTIARGYALAYYVVQQVVKNKGDNNFLHVKEFHADVYNKYFNTDKVIKLKTTVSFK